MAWIPSRSRGSFWRCPGRFRARHVGDSEPNHTSETAKAHTAAAMSLVEVILPGHYWDSWLYAGKMYLFQLDGTVRVLDWDQLVKGMRHRRNANRLLHLLLAQSNHLYSAFRSPTIDPTSRDQLNQAFEGLDGLVIEVSPRLIATAELTRIDNPLPFPHTDCAVYMHTIFAGNQKGLGRLQASDQLSGSNSDRVWDGPVVSLAAGYGS